MALEPYDPNNVTPGEIYLGPEGDELRTPPEGRRVNDSKIKETRSEEMASGRLVEDELWRKNEWTLSYEVLEGPNLEFFVELYELGQFLNLIIVERNGSISEYEVQMQPFDMERITTLGDWHWEGVEIVLRQVNPDASSN